MTDFSGLAAQAGVVWDDSNRWATGHQARVLTTDGISFYHPCTCWMDAAHDAMVPSENPSSTAEPEYAPLPDPQVTPSAPPPPDPADEPPIHKPDKPNKTDQNGNDQ